MTLLIFYSGKNLTDEKSEILYVLIKYAILKRQLYI